MDIPDVTGFTLGNAEKILAKRGIAISDVNVTASPRFRPAECSNDCRVLRIKKIDDAKVEILACKPL